MEDGSLLPNALRSMQQMRENEQNLDVPFYHFFPSSSASTASNEDGDDDRHEFSNTDQQMGTRNALIISIYCIDSIDDVKVNELPLYRKNLLRKLASIHHLIHTKLIPVYNKRYAHKWFTGGEGICFGIHCQDANPMDSEDGEVQIPHLRSVVSYGPHPLDEFVAMAMMKCITIDLHRHYKSKVAVECWDVDDGQILLIEGASNLPSWVDDDVGVEGMAKRVYFVDGNVCLLPPSVKSQKKTSTDVKSSLRMCAGDDNGCGKTLTRMDALTALVEDESIVASTSSLADFNRAIQNRLSPFCKVMNQTLSKERIRSLLTEHLHTAAIVLPLQLAIMIRHRSDLIAVAILSFCRHATDVKSQKKGKNNTLDDSSSIGNEDKISFENLCFTSIKVPKTLYAMLLTAAGQLPPPMKIPKHYKSMELNRIKRQFKNGGIAYAHFRHAVEAGIRLSLGFEWITCAHSSTPTGRERTDDKTRTGEHSLISISTEERVNLYGIQIDTKIGGDGKWIQSAWEDGPNATKEDNKIDALLKCPLWNPEILRGGICPIRHPGKTVRKHVQETAKFARKRERSCKETVGDFPTPRADEVDPDDWIDLDSIDDLEHKMKSLVKDSTKVETETAANVDDDGKGLMTMDTMMKGLETFVSGSSDIRGVSSQQLHPTKMDKKEESGHTRYDERIFLQILHKTLTASDANDLQLDDIEASQRGKVDNTNDFNADLLKYFSATDLNFNEDAADNIENNEIDFGMKELMRTMDEQLTSEQLDREFQLPNADEGVQDTEKLPFDDPTAMKATVLSNMLESLAAQGSTSGPATTLLMETNEGND